VASVTNARFLRCLTFLRRRSDPVLPQGHGANTKRDPSI